MADEPPFTDQDLTSLLDDARADEAARVRSRRRWLQQQAQQDAGLSGVLLDAVEHGHAVTVRTTGGQSHRGRVRDVGADWCLLSTATGRTLVHVEAVAVVLPDLAVAAPPAADHRAAPRRTNFTEALSDLATERPVVVVDFRGPAESVRGELVAVGEDVATVATQGIAPGVYVALSSVAAVSFPSG